ncbi:MAG: hypothetical protein HOG12_15520 [Alphaproteobacteria bacterium]|nr:hypothetical protein [Alphaproteobacteria bacterium]MBT5158190.1 hypothetical protein [Alphaproteobacteria bacterium]
MPASYAIDTEANRAVITATARLTDDELVACVIELRNDPDLPMGCPTLSDLTQVTHMDVTMESFETIAKIMTDTDERRGAAKVAIVVGKEGDLLLGKLFAAVGRIPKGQTSIEIFRSKAEAEAWIS